MQVITLLLEKSLQKQAEDIYAKWVWFSHPKWYVLAILLVELCSYKTVEFSDRAYSVAQACFDQYAPLMSDTDSGMFWRPIARLMRRLQKVRANAVAAGVHYQSMGGISEVEFSETAKQDNVMDFSTFCDQGSVASNQVIPVSTNSICSEHNNKINGDSENSLEADDGMAWINWDLFLTDLNSTTATV